jgi:hypothetical protein
MMLVRALKLAEAVASCEWDEAEGGSGSTRVTGGEGRTLSQEDESIRRGRETNVVGEWLQDGRVQVGKLELDRSSRVEGLHISNKSTNVSSSSDSGPAKKKEKEDSRPSPCLQGRDRASPPVSLGPP